MNRQVILKNNSSFISCISKINGLLVENAEDLDNVMPMYNLLEYSKNYSKTSASSEKDKILFEQLKTGFKRTIKWNKYRSEISNQTKNSNLNYLIGPTFTNVN